MLNAETQTIGEELMPRFRQFPQAEYGIAVGGAHAKGTADEESDLDIYVFSGAVLPGGQRKELTAAFSPRIERLTSWGDGTPFGGGGTDFEYDGLKVECWLRSSEHIDQTICECMDGVVKRDFVTWTPTGFYNHVALSDLNVMIPVDDPSGIIADWKCRLRKYPPKLREAIVRKHLGASYYWPSNFHYSSATVRQDLIYTTSIVQQTVHNLIQVLFAVNDVYFPGDKKLGTKLHHLNRTPDRFVERIEALIFPAETPSVELLKTQQEELQALVQETKELVQREMSS